MSFTGVRLLFSFSLLHHHIIQSSLNHHSIIIQSSLNHHSIITQSSHSIIIQSSFNHHSIITQSSLNHHSIIIQSSPKFFSASFSVFFDGMERLKEGGKGLMDAERSRYKLVLECVLIITSVVPPELPIKLSLAVNNSLIALAKLGIFCTEPFRIPFGGKTKFCCFDKTGTLTSDQLVLKGIFRLSSKSGDISDSIKPCDQSLSDVIQWTIAGCHSVVVVDDKLIGDPMETLSLLSISWSVQKSLFPPFLPFIHSYIEAREEL